MSEDRPDAISQSSPEGREDGSSNASPSPLDASHRSSDETPSLLDLPGRWAVDKYLEPGAWKLDPHIGWIWAPSLKGGNTHVGTVELRGWGYLTGGGHGALGLPGDEAAKAQDAIGEFVVAAVNRALSAPTAGPASANLHRLEAISSPEGLVERLRALADGGRELTDRHGSVIGYDVHWGDASDALAEAASTIEALRAERDQLISAIGEHVSVRLDYFARLQSAEAARDQALAQVGRLREALEDAAYQFAHDGHDAEGPFLHSGALSTLESIFDLLGWDDPHHIPEVKCDEPGCTRRQTCGKPTPSGYRNVCSEHYAALADLTLTPGIRNEDR